LIYFIKSTIYTGEEVIWLMEERLGMEGGVEWKEQGGGVGDKVRFKK
jgi:hypothetical protein